jgi:hypothetical protein
MVACVGEGEGVVVWVGAGVGVGEAIIPNRPQAMSEKASIDIAIKNFRVTQLPRAEWNDR